MEEVAACILADEGLDGFPPGDVLLVNRGAIGMLETVIFDWAGTVVDYGSCAPLGAFVTLFRQAGIEVTDAEARVPMGAEKRDHIVQMPAALRIGDAWRKLHGEAPSAADIDQLYRRLVPLQIEQIERHTQLIPGALSAYQEARDCDLRIGTTTGYGRAMIETMLEQARAQGFAPDCVVAADEVGVGRPSPAAALANLVQLKVGSVRHCVKVDDTPPGIAEGGNAGMWTVAVALTGNAVGVDLEQWRSLTADQQQHHCLAAYRSLEATGAHYCIDSVAELPPVLADIERRLARGEKP